MLRCHSCIMLWWCCGDTALLCCCIVVFIPSWTAMILLLCWCAATMLCCRERTLALSLLVCLSWFYPLVRPTNSTPSRPNKWENALSGFCFKGQINIIVFAVHNFWHWQVKRNRTWNTVMLYERSENAMVPSRAQSSALGGWFLATVASASVRFSSAAMVAARFAFSDRLFYNVLVC